jgi:hypothetical protein
MSDLTGSLIVWLRTQITDGTEFAGRVPRDLPAKFVLVRRIGGPWEWPVTDVPTVGVECWAATESAAYLLAQQVRARIHSLQGGSVNGIPVYRVDEFAGPAWLPDPNHENHPRFVTTYSVRHRDHLPVS